MKREGPLAGHRQARRPVLRWQAPDGRGQECPVTPDRPVTIGRDAKNTIALDSRAVSKAHAIIELRNGEYTVQDLESANGTRVNGEATLVRVLEPGDEVQIGDVTLRFVDLGGDPKAGASAAEPSGGAKIVKLALAGGLTMVVMVGGMMMLLNPPGNKSAAPATSQDAPLAPANAELVAALKASAETSVPVQDTLKSITQTGVPPAQALYEEGLLRLDNKRWREAAQLMAATVARDPAHPHAAAALEQAAAELDRAASKALAAAERAQAGLRFDDAQLHADEVLLLLDARDPRYGRASKIAEQARAELRDR
jgi:pSer/pThr/pTyr-binding forkhead associated (FHA) protein